MQIAKVEFALTTSVKVQTTILLEALVKTMQIAKVEFALTTSVKVSLFCEINRIDHYFCFSGDMF
jgi:hypothetical protein